MTVLDDILVPEVLSVIEEYGVEVDFIVPSTEAYNPTTGETIEGGSTTYTEKVSPPAEYSIRYVGMGGIRAGDNYVILPASGLAFTPIQDMEVVIGSDTWQVVHITEYHSGASIAAYQLLLRK